LYFHWRAFGFSAQSASITSSSSRGPMRTVGFAYTLRRACTLRAAQVLSGVRRVFGWRVIMVGTALTPPV